MVVLGISCGHDANVCLVTDEGVLLHYEKERFTRVKHAAGRVDDLVRLILRDATLGLDDIDVVATSIPVWPEHGITGDVVAGDLYDSVFTHSRNTIQLLETQLPALLVPHHLGHMAYAYFCSPYEEADLIALDAYGNFTATTIGVGSRGRVVVSHDLHPGNLGSLWAMGSRAIFGDILAAGKLMGLAPYGRPRFLPELRDRYLNEVQGFVLPIEPWRDAGSIAELRGLDEPAWRDERARDWAASVQALTTEVVVGLAVRLQQATGRRCLCLSGGVALNGIANEAVCATGGYESVFVPPAVYDGGLAIGFALYALAEEAQTRVDAMDPRFLSRQYSDREIASAADAANATLLVRRMDDDDVASFAATALDRGATIAVWDDRGESGPRALGHRSILSDARERGRRDYLNSLKGREPFRPFGPSVMAEHAADICAVDGGSPFMLRVVPVTQQGATRLPAITHVDSTTRPQTVDPTDGSVGRLRSILEAFHSVSDCPAILNTSFNLASEPIVESPLDAVRTFKNSPLDVLILGDRLVTRRDT